MYTGTSCPKPPLKVCLDNCHSHLTRSLIQSCPFSNHSQHVWKRSFKTWIKSFCLFLKTLWSFLFRAQASQSPCECWQGPVFLFFPFLLLLWPHLLLLSCCPQPCFSHCGLTTPLPLFFLTTADQPLLYLRAITPDTLYTWYGFYFPDVCI